MSSPSSSQLATPQTGSQVVSASAGASMHQMSGLVRKVSQGEISSTKPLIEALNVTEDQADIDKGLEWIHQCIRWFSERKTEGLGGKEYREYVALGELRLDTPKAKEILRRWFISLTNKMKGEKSGQIEFFLALIYALEIVDGKIFDEDTTILIEFANKLLQKLKEGTYTRSSFKTKGLLMQNLHHCLVKIHDISSSKLDPNDDDGVYKKILSQLERITKDNTYYPFTYQSEILKLDLKKFENDEPFLSCYAMCRRVFQGVYGGLCLAHFARKLVTVEFDHGAMEKAIEMLKKSTGKSGVRKKPWHEWIVVLREHAISILDDATRFETFEKYFDELHETESGLRINEERVALKFGMLDTLILLMQSGCNDTHVKVVEKLMKMGEDYCQKKVLNEDLDIYEAMLDSLLCIYPKCCDRDKAKALLEKLTKVNPKKYKERAQQWLDKSTLDHKLHKECVNANVEVSVVFFNKFLEGEQLPSKIEEEQDKDKVVIDEKNIKIEEMQKELKKFYSNDIFGTIPRMFDENSELHVEELNFDLKYKLDIEKGEIQEVQILLEELFSRRVVKANEQPCEVNKVLMVGNPGTGKTCITKRLCCDWANGKWGKEFEAVYLVPIRELSDKYYDDKSMQGKKKLSCAIMNIHFCGQDDNEFTYMKNLVKDEITKPTTLLILDGLDERAGACSIIIDQALGVKCSLLITSRPYSLERERRLVDLEVDCAGLNKWQIEQFVKTQINEEKSIALLRFLNDNLTLYSIACVPVTLNIMCVLWSGNDKEMMKKTIGESMMVLYSSMVNFIWRRFKKKQLLIDVKGVKPNEVYTILGQLAFRSLKESKIIFTEKWIMDLNLLDGIEYIIMHSGFILLQEGKQQYYFPHLTFQEYFAGLYIAQNLVEGGEEEMNDIEDVILKNKYQGQFKVTLEFTCELIMLHKKIVGVKRLLKILNQKPKEELRVKQALLLVQCLGKMSQVNNIIKKHENVLKKLMNETSNYIQSLLKFFLSSEIYREELQYILEELSTMQYGIKLMPSIVDPLVEAYYQKLLMKDTKIFANVIKHVDRKMDIFVENVKRRLEPIHFGRIVELIDASPTRGEDLADVMLSKWKDEDKSVRLLACGQLGSVAVQVPSKEEEILKGLMNGCEEDDLNIRKMAYCQLGLTIQGVSDQVERQAIKLLVKCKDQDGKNRKEAYSELSELMEMAISQKDLITKQIFDGIEDDVMEVRQACYNYFGRMMRLAQDQGEKIIGLCLDGYKDGQWEIRKASVEHFGKAIEMMEDKRKMLLDELCSGCDDSQYEVREVVYDQFRIAFDMMPNQRDRIVKQLYNGCNDRDWEVRLASYKHLGKVFDESPTERNRVVKELFKGCDDSDDWEIRETSYKYLGKAMEILEDQRKIIWNQMMMGCDDSSWHVRKACYSYFEKAMELKINEEENIVEQLFIGCDDSQSPIRDECYAQLGRVVDTILEKSDLILKQLFKGCSDRLPNVRRVAKYHYDKSMGEDEGEEDKIVKGYPSESEDGSKNVDDKVKSQLEKGKEEEERILLIVKQLCVGLGNVKEIRDISYNQLKRLLEIDLERRDKIAEKLLNECGNKNDKLQKVIYNLLGQALEVVPSQRNKIVEELLNATSDDKWEVRLVVYEQFDKALEFVEEERERLMKKLFDGCKDKKYNVLEVVYNQLGKALEIVEDERKKIVGQILVGCDSEDWGVRRACYNRFGKAMEMVKEERGRLVEQLYVGCGDKEWPVCELSYNQVGQAIELIVEERKKLLEKLMKGCDDGAREVRIACYKQFEKAFQYIPQASERLIEKLLERCLKRHAPERTVVYEQLEIAYKMHVEQREKILDNLLEKCGHCGRDVQRDIYKGLGRMFELFDVRRARIGDQILLGCKDEEDNVRNEAYKQLRKVSKKNLVEDETILELLLEGMKDGNIHVRRSVSKICKDVLEEEKKYSKKLFHCIIDRCLEVDDVGYEIQRQVGSNDEFFDLLMSLDLDVLMKYSRKEVDSGVVSLIIRQMIRRPVVFDKGSDGWKMVVYGVKNEEYNVVEEVVKSIREGVDGFKRKVGV